MTLLLRWLRVVAFYFNYGKVHLEYRSDFLKGCGAECMSHCCVLTFLLALPRISRVPSRTGSLQCVHLQTPWMGKSNRS